MTDLTTLTAEIVNARNYAGIVASRYYASATKAEQARIRRDHRRCAKLVAAPAIWAEAVALVGNLLTHRCPISGIPSEVYVAMAEILHSLDVKWTGVQRQRTNPTTGKVTIECTMGLAEGVNGAL